MICLKNKIAFIHIPKCGGTSVESVLLDLEEHKGDKNFYKMSSKDAEKFFVGTGEDRQHCDQKRIEEELVLLGEDLSNWRFLALVRDPCERIRSEVRYQLATQRRARESKQYKTESEAISSGIVWENAWQHHEKSAQQLLNGTSPVELIKLESANTEFPRLIKEWTNRDVTLEVLNSSKKGEAEDLTEQAKAMVLQKWRGDFNLGGYPFPEFEGWKRYKEWSK